VKVYSIPLRTRFRGIEVREGVLLDGPEGWGEFSPFLEYDAATSAPWLACAREAADVGWPAPLRSTVPVNVTVPACSPTAARAIVQASAGCRTAKVKVAVEAAVRQGWDEIIGADGAFVGMTTFGASAPYKELYKQFGITPEAVAEAALSKLGKK
jgi:O-succinylbenzoate synthase